MVNLVHHRFSIHARKNRNGVFIHASVCCIRVPRRDTNQRQSPLPLLLATLQATVTEELIAEQPMLINLHVAACGGVDKLLYTPEEFGVDVASVLQRHWHRVRTVVHELKRRSVARASDLLACRMLSYFPMM